MPSGAPHNGQAEEEERKGVLEQIADRAPREAGFRTKIRALLFPRSHHRLCQLQDLTEGLPAKGPRFDWFEGVTLFAIAINSVILALADPLDRESVRNQVADIIDAVLTCFFVVEAGVRVVCFGSVLLMADRWFLTDVFVVIGSFSALLSSLIGAGVGGTISFSGLRSFRLLKPIRSLRAIPAARLIISAISASVLGLGDVGLLLSMLLLLFAVGGVSQYNSRLRNRCISLDYYTPRVRKLFPSYGITGFTPFGSYDQHMVREFAPLYEWAVLAPPTYNHTNNESSHFGHTISEIPDVCVNNSMLGSELLFDLLDSPDDFPNISLPCDVFDVNTSDLNASRPAVQTLYSRCYVGNASRVAPAPATAPPTPAPTELVNGTNVTLPGAPWITPETHGLDLFALFLRSLGTWVTPREFGPIYDGRGTAKPWIAGQWSDQTCNNVDALVLNGFRCPFGSVCADVENPFFGIFGFDNLLQALLSVFVSVTFEAWFELSAKMADAVDITAQLYFLVLVMMGGLFVLNLVVAQMTSTFEEAYAEEKEVLSNEQKQDLLEEELETAAEMKDARDNATADGANKAGVTAAAVEAGRRHRDRSKSVVARVGNWFSQRAEEDRVAYDENDSDDEDLQRAELLKLNHAADMRRRAGAAGPHSNDTGSPGRNGEPDEKNGGKDTGANSDDDGNDADDVAAQLTRGGAASGAPALLHMQTTTNLTSIAGFIDDAGDATADQDELRRRREAAQARKISSVADVRKLLIQGINSTKGQGAVCVLILAMIGLMAGEHYGMDPTIAQGFAIATICFNALFSVEILLRWFAFGFFGYFRRMTNAVDVIVVIMSWIDLIVEDLNVPIIRALRLLRFYAIFKTFPTLRLWIKVIRQTLQAAAVLAVVSVCALFISACLGMQLFGGEFCNLAWTDVRPDDTVRSCLNRPRANYDTFAVAMLTSFQIMTGDNWDSIMINGIRSQGGITSLFFIAWLLLSNLVLVNLVIAIVLSAQSEVVEKEEQKTRELAELREREKELDVEYQMKLEAKEATRKRDEAVNERLANDGGDGAAGDSADAANAAAGTGDAPGFSTLGQELRDEDDDEKRATLRQWLRSVVVRRVIFIFVALSCVLMAAEDPFKAPDTTTATVLTNFDLAASIVFLLEICVKLFAFGVYRPKNSFLKQSVWNWIDVFVVVSGFVISIVLKWAFVPMRSDTHKGLEVFRSLRPLRFVAISPSIKHVLGTLGRSIAPLRHLVVVMVVLFCFFGILGVQLFAGSFYSCSIPTIPTRGNCTAAGHKWVNAPLHFDHLGASFTTLFSVLALDRWTDVMWDGVDAVGVDHGFVVNNNLSASIYFVSFVAVAAFFFVNLFVSVLIEGYKRAKDSGNEDGSPFLTATQNAWIRSHHVVMGLVPQVDYDDDHTQEHNAFDSNFVKLRKRVRKVVRHPLFDVVVYCFIVVNFIVLAADRHPKSETMDLVVTLANTVFTLVFAIELTLRIIADTAKRFFFYRWNQFDMVIVVTSLASLVLEYLLQSTTFASFFRTLRVLRLLRLLRKARRLQIVLKRFVLTLLSLKNIAALIVLVFMVFGVMGVKLFGRVARNAALARRSNFSSFINSLVMLLRMCTAGEWTQVMDRCAATPEHSDCDPHLDNCGLNVVAQLYFVIFITVGSFVILNLFVAVVLDTFTAEKQQDFAFLTEWEGGQLLQLWLRFDPEYTFRMESRFLVTFLRSIPSTSVLGRMAMLPKKQRLRHELVFIDSLNLYEHDGLVELQDTMYALCRRAYAFPRRKVHPSDPTYNPIFDDPEEDETKLQEKHDETVFLTAVELEARKRKELAKTMPQELHIIDDRRLKTKADVWFRREERDETRAATADTYNVSARFAVQIIEMHWMRRKKVLRRIKHFRRRAAERDELLRLEEVQRKLSSQPSAAQKQQQQQKAQEEKAAALEKAAQEPVLQVPERKVNFAVDGEAPVPSTAVVAPTALKSAEPSPVQKPSADPTNAPTVELDAILNESVNSSPKGSPAAGPAAGSAPPSPTHQLATRNLPPKPKSSKRQGVPAGTSVRLPAGAARMTTAATEKPLVAAARARRDAASLHDADSFLFGRDNSSGVLSHQDSVRQLAQIDGPLHKLPKAARKQAEKQIDEVALALHRVAAVKDEIRRLKSGTGAAIRSTDELLALGRVLHDHEQALDAAVRLRDARRAAKQRAEEVKAEAERREAAEAAAANNASAIPEADDGVGDDDSVDDETFFATL